MVSFNVEERLEFPLEMCLEHLADYWQALGVGSELLQGRNRTHFFIEAGDYALFQVSGEVRLRAAGRRATVLHCQGQVDMISFPFASRIAGEIIKHGIRRGADFMRERSAAIA